MPRGTGDKLINRWCSPCRTSKCIIDIIEIFHIRSHTIVISKLGLQYSPLSVRLSISSWSFVQSFPLPDPVQRSNINNNALMVTIARSGSRERARESRKKKNRCCALTRRGVEKIFNFFGIARGAHASTAEIGQVIVAPERANFKVT